ncbi:MAG: hypothetical protein ABIN80_04705 [Dyadobacter sp.]|uniref:hypothetical protein n=1 Tax=Dyadobacter sp. TaxID=1914288 RepID=UPI003265BEDD
MGVFGDIANFFEDTLGIDECTHNTVNPYFWATVASLKTAKHTKSVTDFDSCLKLGRQIAQNAQISGTISNNFIECACKKVFSKGGNDHIPVWHPWENIGGKIKGNVGAVAIPNTNIVDLYVRGTDDTLWQKAWDNGKWIDWTQVDSGFKIFSSPKAVSSGPMHRSIYAVGADGGVYHKYWDGQWHNWENLGGKIKGNVGAVGVPGTNVTDLYTRGMDDTLWQQYWSNGWSGWFQVDSGFKMTCTPTVLSANQSHRAIYATGQDGNLYLKNWDGQWHPWQQIGGKVAGDVSGLVLAKINATDLYARGWDNRLWQKIWQNCKWGDFFKLDADFKIISSPSVVSLNINHRDVYAVGENGNVYHKFWS